MTGSSCVSRMAACYPQLLFPLSTDTQGSAEYRAAVLRGMPTDREPQFIGSDRDQLWYCRTPAGEAAVWYLEHREDFEHALCALAYRCEPRDILPSVGASMVSGLINWEKIRSHKLTYFASGGLDWKTEFRRFTSEKANYRDTLILLSSGPYSAIPAETLQLSEGLWLEKSVVIRKYHELTHFVCRRLWPEKADTLRDEIIADCIGLLAAFGEYNDQYARTFLGIENRQYRPGGRLEHYFGEPAECAAASRRAENMIAELSNAVSPHIGKNVFEIIAEIY